MIRRLTLATLKPSPYQVHALLDLHAEIHRDAVQTISIYLKVIKLAQAVRIRLTRVVFSLVTGTVALAFSALGVLSSGIVISKFKPRARYLAIWNVFVGILSVLGMIAYSYLGCIENENSIVINHSTP